MFGNGSGSQWWRLIDPAAAMQKRTNRIHVTIPGEINEEHLEGIDIAVIEGCVDKEGISYLYYLQQEKGLKIVVDQDDLIEIEDSNPLAFVHEQKDFLSIIKKTLEIADMVTTTTPYLAKKLEAYNNNVVVLPNYMLEERWEMPTKYVNYGGRVKIGWVGAISHANDIAMIKDVIKEIQQKRSNVDFVFVGDPRAKELLENDNVEVMLGVPFEVYPKRLSGLNFDIGIAPLVDTEFARCKSPIKVLEYGINKTCVVASNVEPYKEFEGYIDLASNKEEFVSYLLNLIDKKELREQKAEELYKRIKLSYMLDANAHKWVQAYKSLL